MDEVFTMTITEYSKRTRIGINTIRRLTKAFQSTRPRGARQT